jgi:hypothetical protein
MQFSIDSILMTLLVGCVSSLSIMSVLFLFCEPYLSIPIVGRVFRFVMFEKKPYLASKEARPIEVQTSGDNLFIGLLVVASLFGLGVAAEVASENFSRSGILGSVRSGLGVQEDRDIRLASFESVSLGEISSGRSNAKLRRLYTDYTACSKVLKMSGNSKTNPCSLIKERVRQYYYYAKNSVFFHQTYFDELNKDQSRIDFMRSMSLSFLSLSAFLALGFLAAFSTEMINYSVASKLPVVGREFVIWWKLHVRGGKSFVGHMKNLSEIRLTLFSVASFMIGFWALQSWEGLESAYDNRVFGYFLCENCRSEESPPGEGKVRSLQTLIRSDALKGSDSEIGYSPMGTPDSSYHIFSSPTGHFEPSGVASLGLVEGRNLFVVANDKDSDRLYLYEIDNAGKLQFLQYIRLLRKGDGRRLKIEALTVTSDGTENQRPSYLFVGGRRTAPNGDKDSLVFSARFPSEFQIGGTDILLHLSPVPGSQKTCLALRLKYSGRCDIEGLAYLEVGVGHPRLLIGVRSIGDVGPSWRPMLGLLSLSLSQRFSSSAIGDSPLPSTNESDNSPPEPVLISNFRFPSLPGSSCIIDGKRAGIYGVSDLAILNNGEKKPTDVLILSSYEKSDKCSVPSQKSPKDSPYLVYDVQGAVWKAKVEDVLTKEAFARWFRAARPIVALAHKPEGIAALTSDSDTALIIFDDDAVRKSVDRVPDTFAVNQNESVFLTFKAGE